jgi:hypothetical protein
MLNEVKRISTINNKLLVFAFLVLAMLFLFFGSGEIMGGINGNMSENGWLGSNSCGGSLLQLYSFGVSLSASYFIERDINPITICHNNCIKERR